MAKTLAKSERLGLQTLSLEHHFDAYHAHMSDPRSFKFLHREPSKSLEESRQQMLTRHLPSSEHPYKEMYAIILRGSEDANGKPVQVGQMGIPRVTDDAVEVGYGVNPKFWGNGYAAEAVRLFVSYYWGVRGGDTKDKIIAYTHPDNIASVRVCEKAGFKRNWIKERAYKAADMETGELKWYPAILWSIERPTS